MSRTKITAGGVNAGLEASPDGTEEVSDKAKGPALTGSCSTGRPRGVAA